MADVIAIIHFFFFLPFLSKKCHGVFEAIDWLFWRVKYCIE